MIRTHWTLHRNGLLILGSLAFFLCFSVEITLWWALAKTYSRGGWMAVVGAAGAWLTFLAWQRYQKAKLEAKKPNPLVNKRFKEKNKESKESRALANSSSPVASLPSAKKSKITQLKRWHHWILPVTRLVIIVICLIASSFSTRLAPSYTREDRSALNRIDLWKGGLELIEASPMRGWGWGQSGASFMHWTQPIGREEGYLSMVNSYLTVAVEAGLPLFTLLFALILTPLVFGLTNKGTTRSVDRGISPMCLKNELHALICTPVPLNPIKSPSLLLRGLTASWAAWLCAMFFSNLWIIKGLWVLPSLCAVGIVAVGASLAKPAFANRHHEQNLHNNIIKNKLDQIKGNEDHEENHPKTDPFSLSSSLPSVQNKNHNSLFFRFLSIFAAILKSLGIAVLASVFFWLGGAWLMRDKPVLLDRESDGAVSLTLRTIPHSADRTLHSAIIFPDAQVLGESYGQELRRWMLSDGGPSHLVIYDTPPPPLLFLLCQLLKNHSNQAQNNQHNS